jgi:hypothetical protein
VVLVILVAEGLPSSGRQPREMKLKWALIGQLIVSLSTGGKTIRGAGGPLPYQLTWNEHADGPREEKARTSAFLFSNGEKLLIVLLN